MSSINNDISQLKKIILDTAIRGKLVPQNENDEDAGMLLEKIKAEKEKLVKEGKIKKEKPLPEIKPEEIPFEIPRSWRWVRLGEVLSIIRGVSYKKGEDHLVKNEGDIVLLRGQNMQEGKLILENVIYISKGLVSDNQFVSKGEIVVTLSSGSKHLVGKTAFVDQDGEFTIGAFYAKFLLNRALDNKFIFTYTLSDLYKEGIFKDARGTNINNLTNSRLNELLFPLPSLAEQQRIVAKIESLFKLADEIDSRRISLAEKVKQLKSAILQEAITGKLVPQDENDEDAGILLEKIKAEKEKLIKEGKIKKEKPLTEIKPEEIPFEIPKSWRWVRLNEVFDVRDGTHDTPKYVEQGYPLITSKNLVNGNLSFDDIKNISEADYNQIKVRSKVEIGDILFAMIGTIGNPVIVDVERDFAIKNVALFKKIIESKNTIKYLFYYLLQQADLMKQKSAGGVQSFVPLGFLRSYVFPLPPLTEQQRIVAKIEELFKNLDQLAKRVR